ncbi:MAG: response regulator [Acetobacteraceae bacterium]|nr:response regulator [Acetobacteraceae bacterium]
MRTTSDRVSARVQHLGIVVENSRNRVRATGSADGCINMGANGRLLLKDCSTPVVLVVEDDPIILETTVENLHDLGYATLSAVDAAGAMDVLRSDTHIDLMFSDIVMPGGMDGVELAGQAKRLRPGMPIALTSGYSAAIVDGVPYGIPLLSKPYLRADLARTLAGLLTY